MKTQAKRNLFIKYKVMDDFNIAGKTQAKPRQRH